jgi:hypothetical protein
VIPEANLAPWVLWFSRLMGLVWALAMSVLILRISGDLRMLGQSLRVVRLETDYTVRLLTVWVATWGQPADDVRRQLALVRQASVTVHPGRRHDDDT